MYAQAIHIYPAPRVARPGGSASIRAAQTNQMTRDVGLTFQKRLFSMGCAEIITKRNALAEIDHPFLQFVVLDCLICQGLHCVKVFARVVYANLLFLNV